MEVVIGVASGQKDHPHHLPEDITRFGIRQKILKVIGNT